MKKINKKIFLLVFTTLMVLMIAAISYGVVMYYSSDTKLQEGSTIIMVPVYGQSLALGEESELITNVDSLSLIYNNKVLSVNLDDKFGFFANTVFKQDVKRLLRRKKRVFELSAYGIGEFTAARWIRHNCQDSLISVFSEGQGNTGIDYLNTNSAPYKKLLEEVTNAFNKASSKNCKLVVPAFCWLQGENDITHNTGQGYKQKLQHFRAQFDLDVKRITHQTETVKCILYQSCCLSLSETKFDSLSYTCPQMDVPQAQMELVRDDENFCASGPVYPYSIAREYVHLDGISQKRLGYLEGISLQKVLGNQKSKGLTPSDVSIHGNTIDISYNIPYPPLVLDTVQVKYVSNYGFSVINKEDKNILERVHLKDNHVILTCCSSPYGCKVRYGVNGDYWKSGKLHGPRGNLRDSQGNQYSCKISGQTYRLDNWSYMFEFSI